MVLAYLTNIGEDLFESASNESFIDFLRMLQFNDDLIPGGEYRDLHFRNLVAEVRTQVVLYQHFRKRNPAGVLKRDR